MKISRRTLIKGLTASAAAHSFGALPGLAQNGNVVRKNLVVYLFGHQGDDLFLDGVKQGTSNRESLTVLQFPNGLLHQWDAIQQSLNDLKGQQAIAFLDHANHAVFHEWLREKQCRLLSLGRHSWHSDNLSSHLITTQDSLSFPDILADSLLHEGSYFSLQHFTPSSEKILQIDAESLTGSTRGSSSLNSKPLHLTPHNIDNDFSSFSSLVAVPVETQLGFAMARAQSPYSSITHCVALNQPKQANLPHSDSAVTLLLEL